MFDPYEQLGVERNATPAEITKAYRRKAILVHPDRNPDDEHAKTKFQLLQEAYEILRDPTRRAKYDASGDGSKDNLQARATALLVGLIERVVTDACNAAVAGQSLNIVASLRSQIHASTREVEGHQISVNSHLPRVRKLLKRTRRKNGEGSLIEDALNAQIQKAEDALVTQKNTLDAYREMLRMLEEYEDVADKGDFAALYAELAGSGSVTIRAIPKF